MSSLVKEFNDYRTRMNEVILSKNNLVMKRLWNLDTNTYENGALDTKTKEMLGLVVRRDGCFVVMIVSGTTWVNAMNWELQQPGCTRSLRWPISSEVRL
jgi:hypothetical protein